MKGVTSMITKPDKNQVRKKRHARVRSKLSGTTARPRLNVYRSNKHIYAQLVDDLKGITLASASTLDKDVNLESTSNVDAAKKVGEIIAKRAVEQGVKEVVFDRGGYLYHGRIQALADAARENGLQF
jgi:large subunit ribosomal protein L18